MSNLTGRSVYFSGTFKDCEALESVDFGGTITPTNLNQTFYNCKNLSLDCAGWNKNSLTDVTNFNYNAPGVINAPVLNN